MSHKDEKPCLHCALVEAMLAYFEKHGGKRNAAGKLGIDANAVIEATMTLQAELMAALPTAELRDKFILRIAAALYRQVKSRVAAGTRLETVIDQLAN
jgi:hypothetical protein